MIQVGCCGVLKPSDWQNTNWGKGHKERYPHSCCQTTTTGNKLKRFTRLTTQLIVDLSHLSIVNLSQLELSVSVGH